MGAVNFITTGIRKFFNATLDIYVYFVLIAVFLLTAYPFWYILMYSVSIPAILKSGFLLIPSGFTLDSYINTIQTGGILQAFLISASRSIIGPVLSSLVSMMSAYALSRRDLPGRKFFNICFILTMYFGAGLIPTYLLYRNLGITNSFWVYILPGIMSVFGMILMRTYIENLPPQMEECAYIDGANELVIFFRIIIPLCVPVIAAITLFGSVGQWNSYTDTLIFNSSNPKLYTLQYILVTLVSSIAARDTGDTLQHIGTSSGTQIQMSAMSVRMAITIISIVPISLVYPFLQRFFIKGIMIGAVKG